MSLKTLTKTSGSTHFQWTHAKQKSDPFFAFLRQIFPTPYLRRSAVIILAIAFIWFGFNARDYLASLSEVNQIFISISTILCSGIFALWLSQKINIPDFVLFIILGIFVQPYINFSTAMTETLVLLGAATILFLGGFEVEGIHIKKLAVSLGLISTVGVVLSGFFLAYAISWVIILPIFSTVLLGIALASTDPAAIIPSLATLKFKRPIIKMLVISESAFNDVIGAVLTLLLLSFLGEQFININQIFSSMASVDTAIILAKNLLIGGMVGLAFGALMTTLAQSAESYFHIKDIISVPMLFLGIALGAYTLAQVLGGSGFLAVFIAGMIFQAKEHHQPSLDFLNEVLVFVKAIIFFLLGSFVNLASIVHYLLPGIAVALIFMFIIRPLIVLVTTSFDFVRGNLNLREICFFSWVRETGVIPAVLLISFVVNRVPQAEAMLNLGLVIILTTLVIQPATTPWLTQKLDLTE